VYERIVCVFERIVWVVRKEKAADGEGYEDRSMVLYMVEG